MCKISDVIVLLFLLTCSLNDLKTRRLPVWLLLGMSAVMVFLYLFRQDSDIVSSAVGVLTGGIFCLFGRFTEEAIGYGDSWIILLLGLYLGFEKQLAVIMAAFLLAGLFALGGLMKQKWRRTYSIPFVPFLTAAYIGVWLL